MKRLALLLLTLAATASAQNTCVECHDAQQPLVEKSAHPQLSCTDCHNGNASAAEMEAAHAEAKHFIGKPKPLQLAQMCGDCHKKATDAWKKSPHLDAMLKSDPAGASCSSCHTRAAAPSSHSLVDCGDEDAPTKRLQVAATCARCHGEAGMMERSGLRADAMALYVTSAHGVNVLEEKKEDGPTCIDCHSPHEALRASDPASETNPLRVPATCARCHGDEKKMKPHGIDTGIPAEFALSRHSRDIKDGGPSCASCHGAHAARVPAPDELPSLCARCHLGPSREFSRGPHGKATWTDPASGEAGPVTCAHCHDSHGAPRPAAPFAEPVCSKCHEPGSKAMNAAVRISEFSAATTSDITALHQLLSKAQARGHELGDGCEAMAALDGASLDLAALGHGLSPENCRRVRESVQRDAAALKTQLVALTPEKRPLGWLPFMWSFLFAGVALMWAKSRKFAAKN